jgi:hypothetical protein
VTNLRSSPCICCDIPCIKMNPSFNSHVENYTMHVI